MALWHMPSIHHHHGGAEGIKKEGRVVGEMRSGGDLEVTRERESEHPVRIQSGFYDVD